eukprot:TRINITY_DN779_c0_g1_i15.p1 TRINITY_DN779_c0_g1~~TRINITY_DN779_c0_g1_i15.p1  ORF type:complete len:143 (-),score=32.13 TRINITY_DN779_c0_g1_i15:817-1245(-)
MLSFAFVKRKASLSPSLSLPTVLFSLSPTLPLSLPLSLLPSILTWLVETGHSYISILPPLTPLTLLSYSLSSSSFTFNDSQGGSKCGLRVGIGEGVKYVIGTKHQIRAVGLPLELVDFQKSQPWLQLIPSMLSEQGYRMKED